MICFWNCAVSYVYYSITFFEKFHHYFFFFSLFSTFVYDFAFFEKYLVIFTNFFA